jgi:hypothetical protein
VEAIRYAPARSYLTASVIAIALAAFSAGLALRWTPAIVAVVLFLISGTILALLGFQPPIEIRDGSLVIGRRSIPWESIRGVDCTGWVSPLVVVLNLAGGRRRVLIYPGDPGAGESLLRQLRRRASRAAIDGIPHGEFWGSQPSEPPAPEKAAAPVYRVVRDEDEAEIERLYQLLKTVGHLDASGSGDEK